MKARTVFCLLITIIFFSNCHKKPVETPDFIVSNAWQCTINGINYSGSIDTSFIEIRGDMNLSKDTLLYCSGTSSDKKSNILFRLFINRMASGNDLTLIEFSFDTCSTHRLWEGYNSLKMKCRIENFNGRKFSGSFYGTASIDGYGNAQNVSDGKFSFEIDRGSNEPKFLSCNINNKNLFGCISEARIISNTLIMNGFCFHTDSTFQLMIRTGGTIKPGIYKSMDGNAGFQTFIPSIVNNYVSDAIGNLTVTIESVKDNIIEGSFSGTGQGFAEGTHVNITGGKFRCRVKNYRPQVDSLNKWGFSESNGLQYPYQTWGGNILNVVKYQQNNTYYLVINGESDNGSSVFKIKLHSYTPIAPGIYETGSWSASADSIYFYCAPMNLNYVQPNSSLACQIDTINNQKLVGHFYGNINVYNSPYGGVSMVHALRRGFFKVSF